MLKKIHKNIAAAALICLVASLGVVCVSYFGRVPDAELQAERNPEWAKLIVGKKGLPNLHQINEELYRGAQPDKEGMKELAAMGVKTVVNLRWLHSDKDEIGNENLKLIEIPMKAWDKDLDEEAILFLKAVTDPENQPVFFHCQHGADRTGTMCAMYRMTVENWTVDQAIEELTQGGYNFHAVWKNLPQYLKTVDISSIRKQADLPEITKKQP